MDWHLLNQYSIIKRPKSEDGLLRTTLHFKKKWIYHTAIIFNSIARFTWILRFWYLGAGSEKQLGITLALVEIFRRWVWVFFRLEREWTLNLPQPTVYQELEPRNKE
jgi:hypothetical protein